MNGWKLVFRRGLVLFFVGMVGLMIGGFWWFSGDGDEKISLRGKPVGSWTSSQWVNMGRSTFEGMAMRRM